MRQKRLRTTGQESNTCCSDLKHGYEALPNEVTRYEVFSQPFAENVCCNNRLFSSK